MQRKILVSISAISGIIALNFLFKHIARRYFSRNVSSKYLPPKREKNKKLNYLGPYNSIRVSEPGIYKLHVKDLATLKKKIQTARADSLKEIQIVCDFDFTMSAYEASPGIPAGSIFSIVKNCKNRSPAYKQTYEDLFKKYGKYEIDHSLSLDEKRKYMWEWHDGLRQNFAREGIKKEEILDAINDGNLYFRPRALEFLKMCFLHKIPYYIMSGGMSDVIYTVFRSYFDVDKYEQLQIISNDFYFDQNDVLVDLKMQVYSGVKDLILNKQDQGFLKTTLLFGDFMTDLAMAKNIGQKTLISFAFLDRSKISELDTYINGFDLVISGFGDFYVHQILFKYLKGEDVLNLIEEAKLDEESKNILLDLFVK